jgi:hypothetical protein
MAEGHKDNVGCAGVGRLMIFSDLWALRALFPSGGGRGMQDSCRVGVSCRTARGGCDVVGRLTNFSSVVWWYLSFVQDILVG